MSYLALILLLIAYFALSSRRVVAALRGFYDNRVHGGLLVAMLIIPYVLAALPGARADPAGFGVGLAAMLAYLFVPGLALLFRPERRGPLDALDIVAVLALWLPIEFDLLPDVAAQIGEASLPIPLLTGIVLGFLLFLVIRPLDGLGYTFRLRPTDPLWALAAWAAFGLVGIPLGVAMGFIRPGLAEFDAAGWLVRLISIYFFNALPEEMLFRGIIQNLIEQRWGRGWLTLGAAAAIFGLAHINNTTAFHAPPNWPYVLMAGLAGIAYGWAWRKTGKITGSAITHTLVNFVWGVVFASP